MGILRTLAVVSLSAVLAACSTAATRFHQDGGADIAPTSKAIEAHPLPPPGDPAINLSPPSSPHSPFVSGASEDAIGSWKPYSPSRASNGHWGGATAWTHPPKQRSPRREQTQSASAYRTPAPLLPDRTWAEKWVPDTDREAFNAAVKASMKGMEGRWRTETGLYGTALPADRRGKCSQIELLLSPSPSGLPIQSRGSIIECA